MLTCSKHCNWEKGVSVGGARRRYNNIAGGSGDCGEKPVGPVFYYRLLRLVEW